HRRPTPAAINTLSLHDALPILRQGTTTYWKQLREQNGNDPVIAVEPVGTVQQAMKSDQICDLLLFDGPAKASKLVEEIAKASNLDRKSTRLNSSHVKISYAVFC